MASSKRKTRNQNPILRYFQNTIAELRKVRWPTLEEGWTMTKLVLIASILMSIFLGAVDLFFGRLLRGIIEQNILFIILGLVVVAALLGSAVLIGQGEEI